MSSRQENVKWVDVSSKILSPLIVPFFSFYARPLDKPILTPYFYRVSVELRLFLSSPRILRDHGMRISSNRHPGRAYHRGSSNIL
jgi:hypothetical protein